MDIKIIQYFLTVAEEKNITAAAKKLHISQPPLSRQLKNLENEIGTPLFIRNNAGMMLTDAGKLLQKRGNELVRLFRLTQLELQETANASKERFTIGSYGAASTFLLPTCVDLLAKEFPNIEVHIFYGSPEEIIRKVRSGEIDVGFIRTPFEDMASFDLLTLYTEDWIVAIPRDHPLAFSAGTSVSVESLSENRLIVPSRASICKPLMDLFLNREKDLNIICYYYGLENALALVEKGVGIAICPRSTKLLEKGRNFVVKDIESTKIMTSLAAIRQKDRSPSDRMDRFWKLFQKHFDGSAEL